MKKRLKDRLTVEFRTESGTRNWDYLHGIWKGSRRTLLKDLRTAIEPRADGRGKTFAFYYTFPRWWSRRILSGMPEIKQYQELLREYCREVKEES